MSTEAEVKSFLNGFKAKLEVFDVISINREKNLQALFDLEMSQIKTKEILKTLEVKD